MAHITLFSDVATTPGHYLFIFFKGIKKQALYSQAVGKDIPFLFS